MNPNLSSQQFEQHQLFDPGPPVAPQVDHAKEAMEFASRPDIVWHSNKNPFMRPEPGRNFHTGTSTAAYDRARDLGNPGRAVVHPVALTGEFQLPSSPVEAGMRPKWHPTSGADPTRWNDDVVNDYPVGYEEEGWHGNYDAIKARLNAGSHMESGKILPYINKAEHRGSTSFVTTTPSTARFFNDELTQDGRHVLPTDSDKESHILTGKFLGRHSGYEDEAPGIKPDSAYVSHLPFEPEDVQRLGLRNVFHNNVPGIHRQAAALASKFFDVPVGLHPDSPSAQVPAVETEQERKLRMSKALKDDDPAPDIVMGLNKVVPHTSVATGLRNEDVVHRLRKSSMPNVDHHYDTYD